MRRTLLIYAIAALTDLTVSAAMPRFHTERIAGRNYVALPELIKYYGFDRKWTRNKQSIVLKKKYVTLTFRLDSHEAFVEREHQDVRLWLNFPIVQENGTIYVTETDVMKTLDPVLRPWAVSEFNVRTIMIDPGHGGFDKGTAGVSGKIVEKNFALDTARRLERHLKKAGLRTLMTRRRDEYVPLEDRAEQANVSSADLFVSVHYNSARPDRGPKGIETFCLTPAGASSTGRSKVTISDFKSNPGNRRDAHNMLLAYYVHHELVKNSGASDRGVKRARFVVLKELKKPGILVECGFLSNPGEEKKIRSATYREQLAKYMAEGILTFISHANPTRKSGTSVKLRDS
jgi:N-acetylmuramoyl-L-alanine amidase